jgi:hypothetical protein
MSEVAFDRAGDRELEQTASSILAAQRADGAIPWFIGGRLDPWNHVEAAMALAVAGYLAEARSAFSWLANHQDRDGSWFAAYREDGAVLEDHCDTNAVAYVATGLLLYLNVSGDERFARSLYGTVERALDYVARHVDEQGMLPWSVGPGDATSPHSLLAASSSIVCSFRSGAELSNVLGLPNRGWLEAASRIARAVTEEETVFLDKSDFAMDWYYPALAGVLDRVRGRERLAKGWSRFVVDGHGVRCRSDADWVTAAESAECAIAFDRVGFGRAARRIIAGALTLRDDDGSFRTGAVHIDGAEFPDGERTTYSAAAMILAADVLSGGPTRRIFGPLS